ncbi:hypothetical protein PTSG_09729 [Salpingoeca rosetta]|uniref:Poly [ADP-ribose] polymerase n=1 Tax=Salpingoeca rosetta (strain ATCC 50818 / BSB-021) TaxID=946362 RepID=F2UNW0_SALR5|nr:uncharacterized protein PTSG_09729 [Salpingoeca rosetta]EGD79315.1 hypothetical protein PTSG_09729 [Salpingoeca rosetta]|eukprot:XP_004989084.1 hypothetical protein PTSG_09729 [Salpingoeca rosetta]
MPRTHADKAAFCKFKTKSACHKAACGFIHHDEVDEDCDLGHLCKRRYCKRRHPPPICKLRHMCEKRGCFFLHPMVDLRDRPKCWFLQQAGAPLLQAIITNLTGNNSITTVADARRQQVHIRGGTAEERVKAADLCKTVFNLVSCVRFPFPGRSKEDLKRNQAPLQLAKQNDIALFYSDEEVVMVYWDAVRRPPEEVLAEVKELLIASSAEQRDREHVQIRDAPKSLFLRDAGASWLRVTVAAAAPDVAVSVDPRTQRVFINGGTAAARKRAAQACKTFVRQLVKSEDVLLPGLSKADIKRNQAANDCAKQYDVTLFVGEAKATLVYCSTNQRSLGALPRIKELLQTPTQHPPQHPAIVTQTVTVPNERALIPVIKAVRPALPEYVSTQFPQTKLNIEFRHSDLPVMTLSGPSTQVGRAAAAITAFLKGVVVHKTSAPHPGPTAQAALERLLKAKVSQLNTRFKQGNHKSVQHKGSPGKSKKSPRVLIAFNVAETRVMHSLLRVHLTGPTEASKDLERLSKTVQDFIHDFTSQTISAPSKELYNALKPVFLKHSVAAQWVGDDCSIVLSGAKQSVNTARQLLQRDNGSTGTPGGQASCATSLPPTLGSGVSSSPTTRKLLASTSIVASALLLPKNVGRLKSLLEDAIGANAGVRAEPCLQNQEPSREVARLVGTKDVVVPAHKMAEQKLLQLEQDMLTENIELDTAELGVFKRQEGRGLMRSARDMGVVVLSPRAAHKMLEADIHQALSQCTAKATRPVHVLTANISSSSRPAQVDVVCGDFKGMRVDVIVNAANEDLMHGGGIALAIAEAAGLQFSDECQKSVAAHGRVRAGTARHTSSGDLAKSTQIKHVLHAVAPIYSGDGGSGGGKSFLTSALASLPKLGFGGDTQAQLSASLRACVQEAIRLAGRLPDVSSIGIPAIGSGVFGWPEAEATREIVKAVVASVNSGSLGNIKRVVLFDAMQAKASAFAAAVGTSMALCGRRDAQIKHVLHAVAQFTVVTAAVVLGFGGDTQAQLSASLRACVQEAIRLAGRLPDVSSIGIPAIGSGVFGWPEAEATREIVKAVVASVNSGSLGNIKRVVLFDAMQAKASAFAAAVKALAERDGAGSKSSSSTTSSTSTTSSSASYHVPRVLEKPEYVWMWRFHERDRWVMYDWDQQVQIEQAHGAGRQDDFRISGDRGGVRSDSKHIPEGEKYPVYFVNLAKMTQRNAKSNFERRIQRVRWTEGMPLPPLFEERRQEALALAQAQRRAHHSSWFSFASTTSSSAARPMPSSGISNSGGSNNSARIVNVRKPEMGTPYVTGKAPKPSSITSTAALPKKGFVLCGPRAKVQAVKDKWTSELHDMWQQSEIKLFENDREHNERLLDHKDVRAAIAKHGAKIRVNPAGNIVLEYVTESAFYEINSTMVKLVEEIKVPRTWTTMKDPRSVEVVPVPAGTQEYQDVVEIFLRGGFTKTVLKVERVQNKFLWDAYFDKRRWLNRHSGGANEKHMFHGTRSVEPNKIVKDSFDFRHARAGMFGRGAYFAEYMSYSDSYAFPVQPPTMNHFSSRYGTGAGVRQVFIARVAAGKVEERSSDSSIVRPSDGYDSVTGTVSANHKAIIIYDLQQAYPEYLITYSA